MQRRILHRPNLLCRMQLELPDLSRQPLILLDMSSRNIFRNGHCNLRRMWRRPLRQRSELFSVLAELRQLQRKPIDLHGMPSQQLPVPEPHLRTLQCRLLRRWHLVSSLQQRLQDVFWKPRELHLMSCWSILCSLQCKLFSMSCRKLHLRTRVPAMQSQLSNLCRICHRLFDLCSRLIHLHIELNLWKLHQSRIRPNRNQLFRVQSGLQDLHQRHPQVRDMSCPHLPLRFQRHLCGVWQRIFRFWNIM